MKRSPKEPFLIWQPFRSGLTNQRKDISENPTSAARRALHLKKNPALSFQIELFEVPFTIFVREN